MMKPEISGLMAVYNGQEYLRDAIESILAQSTPNFELLIIDDGSTDLSVEIIKSFCDERIVLFEQENRGLSGALNIGIQMSKGKYIARVDADDVALPERFRKQYEFLEQNPACVAVGSWINWINMKGQYIYTMKMSDNRMKLKDGLPFKVPISHGASMFRAVALKEIGGYKEVGRHFYHEDVLLMIDLSKKGQFYNIQEPLTNVRIVPSSNTQRALRQLRMHDEIVWDYYCRGELDLGKIKHLGKIYARRKDRNEMSHYYVRIGKMCLEEEFRRLKAIQNLVLGLRHYPLNCSAWFNLLLCFLPKRVIRRWKKLRGVSCGY
jgi:glycosyltransferase involved in cell wall biosynthesis